MLAGSPSRDLFRMQKQPIVRRPAAVCLAGSFGDEELGRDGQVAEVVGDQSGDLQFPPGEQTSGVSPYDRLWLGWLFLLVRDGEADAIVDRYRKAALIRRVEGSLPQRLAGEGNRMIVLLSLECLLKEHSAHLPAMFPAAEQRRRAVRSAEGLRHPAQGLQKRLQPVSIVKRVLTRRSFSGRRFREAFFALSPLWREYSYGGVVGAQPHLPPPSGP